MIDSHTHLDLCEPPDAELVAAADAAGVTRMLTVGIDGASCRAALAAAEDFPQVYAAIGRHPNAARGFDDADLAELRALAAHERCAGDRRDRPGLLPRRRARRGRPAARVRGADRARARDGQAAGDPHARRRRSETLAQLAAEADGVSVVMHCFSMPERLRGVPAARLCDLVRRQRHVHERRAISPRRRARVPEERLLVETDAPYLTPQAVRKQRNQPAFVAHTAAFLAELRGVSVEELGARVERNAARVFGWA